MLLEKGQGLSGASAEPGPSAKRKNASLLHQPLRETATKFMKTERRKQKNIVAGSEREKVLLLPAFIAGFNFQVECRAFQLDVKGAG